MKTVSQLEIHLPAARILLILNLLLQHQKILAAQPHFIFWLQHQIGILSANVSPKNRLIIIGESNFHCLKCFEKELLHLLHKLFNSYFPVLLSARRLLSLIQKN